MEEKKKKILVCDDEQAINHALQLKLGHEGFDVSSALDGDECVNALNKDNFDLLLLDLVLPKKDGFEVLAEMENMKYKVPVVIVSNLGQEEDIARVKHFGVSDYLIKSNTSISDMVAKVKEVLNK